MLSVLGWLAVGQVVTRPNVIVVFSDDHARQAISAYGSKLARTPAIDRLAREGATFDRHYTSNPICAPSRATLLTGKFSHRNGHKDNASAFDGSQLTLPKILQGAGYETAIFGKWHLVSNPTGFDQWEILRGQGEYYNPDFLSASGVRREEGYASRLITEKALHHLRSSRNKPFFMIVSHKAPHRSWEPAPEHASRTNRGEVPEPADLRTDYRTLTSGAAKAGMRIDKNMRTKEDLHIGFTPGRMTPEQKSAWQKATAPLDAEYRRRLAKQGLMSANYQRYLHNYLQTAQSVDDSIGAILAELDRSGLAKNTIVLYTSDQGFFLGEKGWYDKRWFYEPSAGTPLLMRAPGLPGGTRVSAVTSNVDLAPTILDFVGIAAPSGMQGRALAPVVRKADARDIPAYGHFYENNDGEHNAPKYIAIATQRFKAICYYELGEWELFDLVRDPSESTNLWSEPGSKRLRTVMSNRLLSRMREVEEEPAIIDRVSRLFPN